MESKSRVPTRVSKKCRDRDSRPVHMYTSKQPTSRGSSSATEKSLRDFRRPTFSSMQKLSSRCKGNPSATPSQPDVKRPKTPTKEVSKAKRVKNDKDDKKRTETKFTEDKKTAEEDVNAYGNSKHPKRCKDNSSATSSQPDVKHPKIPTKGGPEAKRVKNEDDKKRTETKFTEDKKTAEEDVNAYGNSKHPKRCDDLQHQQENANKKIEHLVEPEKAKNDQEALDGELKKYQERELEAQLTKAKDELSVKSREAKAYQANIDELKRELEQYSLSLSKVEERNFKFTNAFTSAGEGSVLDISNRYRHLQYNNRPAAVRAMKKFCKIDFKEHICNQVMCAYEAAKTITLREASNLIEKLLFELQPITQDPVVHDKELLQTCMILLGYLQKDPTKNTAAITEIKQTLMNGSETLLQRESLPSEVEDYYQSLSELIWCAVARPIPMIIAESPDTYCKCYHELNNDDDDIEDGRAISYVYPVLYTSNKSPRELAQKGKVVLKKQS